MQKFLVFAGTTEGRRALELLAGPERALWASAATEYGGESLPALAGLTVLTGRLEPQAMRALLELERFTCVLDATHPFARAATQNIRAACAAAATPYLRVLRESDAAEDCVYVADASAAARYLAEHATGGVLLTTGSKELDAFTVLPDYRERVFPRVLPVAESLEKCLALGFPAKNIICMQGPFTAELNAALLRQTGAAWLVTKETGAAGGFPEKCEAARLAGAKLLVIGRPEEPEGVTLSALPDVLHQRFGIAPKSASAAENTAEPPVAQNQRFYVAPRSAPAAENAAEPPAAQDQRFGVTPESASVADTAAPPAAQNQRFGVTPKDAPSANTAAPPVAQDQRFGVTPESASAADTAEPPAAQDQRFNVAPKSAPSANTAEPPAAYFPLFVPLAGKTAVVLGAGPIAARRAGALAAFGCKVCVIAPEISQEMEYATQSGAITLLRRRYTPGDCAGAALAVAATNEREANAAAAQECAALGIPVSVADRREESTFYFPGLVQNGAVTIGVTASGRDHRLARRITENIRANINKLQAPDGEELS